MTVTKETLINKVYHQVGLSKARSKQVVEALIEIIKKTLESGEDVLISGFGKFMIRDKAARKGRNPQTSEELQLRARRVVSFKVSGVLKKKINSPKDQ